MKWFFFYNPLHCPYISDPQHHQLPHHEQVTSPPTSRENQSHKLLPLTLQTHQNLHPPFFLPPFPPKRNPYSMPDPLTCASDSPSHFLHSWLPQHLLLLFTPTLLLPFQQTSLCSSISWVHRTPQLLDYLLLPFMVKFLFLTSYLLQE